MFVFITVLWYVFDTAIGHVACLGKKWELHIEFEYANKKMNRSFVGLQCTNDNDVEVGLEEVRCEDVDWIRLAQDKVQR